MKSIKKEWASDFYRKGHFGIKLSVCNALLKISTIMLPTLSPFIFSVNKSVSYSIIIKNFKIYENNGRFFGL
jgi:hypothetical protein